VAVVHEWFSAAGGSEAVYRAIGDLLPQAERFVLWAERDVARDALRLRESWLARTPLRRSKPLALLAMPLVYRTLSRRGFDLVVSSTHAFAHTVKFPHDAHTRYLSYVHSPARYVWSPDFDGRAAGAHLALPRWFLQAIDVRMSRHVDSYAANSREVQARIGRYWKRDAAVIHPPVDVAYFGAAPAGQRLQNRDYLLGVGRWVPYKRFDLMIAIADAAGVPLIIAGSGPEEPRLRRLAAGARVEVAFDVRPARERLRQLYWGARALLYPTHEDFGIVPVEAQACATPVIGLGRGGLLETVTDGVTGFLADADADAARYAAFVRRLDELEAVRIQANAARFSAAVFDRAISAWIRDAASS
jgi:glycosyltransferase involved in cell wall biosynthesis